VRSEIGLLTFIDGNVSPGPWISAELDLYFLIKSTITNEIEDLEVVIVDFWLLSVLKVLTSSLNSAFT